MKRAASAAKELGCVAARDGRRRHGIAEFCVDEAEDRAFARAAPFPPQVMREQRMRLGIRATLVALTAAGCFAAPAARAGDDGSAPLWSGLGSIISPWVGFGKEEPPPIEYRERGKLVVPKSMDLPPPGSAPSADNGAWPKDQEGQRKALAKEEQKKRAAAVAAEPAKMRSIQGFPNAPVTVRASDQVNGELPGESNGGKTSSSSVLENLNPLGWVGLGKGSSAAAAGAPEPDREWLTDPPKGYRDPNAPAATATGQASK